MKKASWKGLLALASLSVVMLLVLAACGSDDPTPTTAAADPTATPEPAKELITFTDLNWNSGHIQTAIASYIVNKGYGYPVDAVTLDTLPGFNALEKGDTQVSMEIWLPNQQEAWDNAVAAGTVIGVGHSLDDNWQSSFVIPGYTQDANPGLQTVEDLKKPEYKALFTTIESGGKASGLGCIPGWACEVVNEEKIPGYDLEDHVEIANPGSVGALDAAIRGAFEKKEDLLFYYWGPTQISAELDLRILEEPPHNDACFEVRACAYPVAEVIVAVHSSLVERAPEVVAFLEKYNFTAAAQVAAETYLSETGAEFDEVAKWWLTNQEEFWVPFVTDEAATKIRAALAS